MFEPSEYHKKMSELQLLQEHEHLCWQYGLHLERPAIRISSSRSILGEWHPETRQIRISEHLIRHYSWDTVINVLKHEMAHQIVSEYFRVHDEPSHGESFQSACKMLACPPPFRQAHSDLLEGSNLWSDTQPSKDHQALMEKLDKLLSLANSDNENEALLAMKKAQELQKKHNISQLNLSSLDNYCYKIIELNKKRTSLQESLVASILQKFYFVDVIHSDLYSPNTGSKYNTVELVGTKENVAIAEYTFHFLMRKIDQLWCHHQKITKAPGREKRSFQCGLLHGFREKLSKIDSESGADTTAMVRANDQYLKLYTKSRYPRLSRSSHSSGGILAGAYGDGKKEGHNIVVSKGLDSTSVNSGKQLTGRSNA